MKLQGARHQEIARGKSGLSAILMRLVRDCPEIRLKEDMRCFDSVKRMDSHMQSLIVAWSWVCMVLLWKLIQDGQHRQAMFLLALDKGARRDAEDIRYLVYRF